MHASSELTPTQPRSGQKKTGSKEKKNDPDAIFGSKKRANKAQYRSMMNLETLLDGVVSALGTSGAFAAIKASGGVSSAVADELWMASSPPSAPLVPSQRSKRVAAS